MSKGYPFELDMISTTLRNRTMYYYYRKLNDILNRKNIFLPKITPKASHSKKTIDNGNIGPQTILDKFRIEKENLMIYKKLTKINNRYKVIDNKPINDKYLRIKKNTLQGVRKIKLNLLKQCNRKIQQRINNTKPVINSLKFKNDFLNAKYYCKNLSRLRPNNSLGNLYLTKNESNIIDIFLSPKRSSLDSKSFIDDNKKSLERRVIGKRLLKKIGFKNPVKLAKFEHFSNFCDLRSKSKD